MWENHFEDSQKMTTVTVIEDFTQIGLENAEAIPQPTESQQHQVQSSSTSPKESKKKKAFRYGTKAERQSDRKKARLKQHNKSHRKRK
jgi:hypothetical protein